MYTEAKRKDEIMEGVTNAVKSRVCARNTVEYWDKNGNRFIRYHATNILTFMTDGLIIVNNGGFNTISTRSRLVQYTPPGISFYTEKGVSYIATSRGSKPFSQTCVINRNKSVTTDFKRSGHIEKLQFIKRYMDTMAREGLPTSPSGDPFVVPKQSGYYDPAMVEGWLNDPDTREPYIFFTFVWCALDVRGHSQSTLSCHVGTYNRLTPQQRKGNFIHHAVRAYLKKTLGV